MAGFGSVAWQLKQEAHIRVKILRGEKLDAFDEVYIQTMRDHQARIARECAVKN